MGRDSLASGWRRCSSCDTPRPVGHYHAKRWDCPDCRSESQLLKKYGVTREQFTKMLAEQGGRCAVCDTHPTKIVVDHNHRTGAVRGLLCNECNRGLGFLRDSIPIVSSALNYLRRTT